MSRLSVVIPVYNEDENILVTLNELARHAPPETEVLIVHDMPEDTTLTVLPHFQSDVLSVQPLLNGYGRGALNAIRWGMSQAAGDFILVIMGDNCDDLTVLPKMLSMGDAGCDVVCGSRFSPGGRHGGNPGLKKALSAGAGLSLYYLAGLPTHDATNSFKLYSRRLLQTVNVESGGGFELGLELVVKAWVCGFRIGQVPYTWKERSAGQSRFQLTAWLPYYLRWYFLAMSYGLGLRLLPAQVRGQGGRKA